MRTKKGLEKPYSTFTLVALVGLIILNLSSSLGVVYSKHLSRFYFSKLQALHKEKDALHVEWSQLLLEQSTWATDVRVERIAKEHLKMVVPSPAEVKVIQ